MRYSKGLGIVTHANACRNKKVWLTCSISSPSLAHKAAASVPRPHWSLDKGASDVEHVFSHFRGFNRRGLIEAHRDYAVQTKHRPISAAFIAAASLKPLEQNPWQRLCSELLSVWTRRQNIEHATLQQRRFRHAANEPGVGPLEKGDRNHLSGHGDADGEGVSCIWPSRSRLNVVIFRSRALSQAGSSRQFPLQSGRSGARREQSVVTITILPSREIGVIHLANLSAMYKHYLSQNLLYRSGHYLSLAERATLTE
jgi:hypothetical protein